MMGKQVYFLLDAVGGWVKIGCSTDPRRRAAALQRKLAGDRDPLILGSIPGGLGTEARLHEYFLSARIGREVLKASGHKIGSGLTEWFQAAKVLLWIDWVLDMTPKAKRYSPPLSARAWGEAQKRKDAAARKRAGSRAPRRAGSPSFGPGSGDRR